MIGKLTIDKSSMNISYFLYTIKIISKNHGKISRNDFVKEMASLVGVPATQNNKENRTAYNKSKLPRYFGFVDIVTDEENQNYLVLTHRGEILSRYIKDNGEDAEANIRYSIETKHRLDFIDLIFDSIIFDSFGKNNSGAEQSNTDVEPPKVVFKTIYELKRATAEEIFYVMFGLNKGLFDSFEDAISAVKKNREKLIYNYSKIMEEWSITNIVNDCKIINIFTDENISLLISDKDDDNGKLYYRLGAVVTKSHIEQLKTISAVYEPLKLFVYTNGNAETADEWIEGAVLGCVSDDRQIFKYESTVDSESICYDDKKTEFIPCIFEKALLAAFQNERKNIYLVIKNTSEISFFESVGKYATLLNRLDSVKDIWHGWSKTPILDEKVYQWLIKNSSRAKNVLKNNEILLPPNLHIVGTIIMNDEKNDTKFDYEFRRCLINTDETGIPIVEVDESKRLQVGTNILLYGVPGSGKSWTIEHEYCKKGTKVERLVFHPDYTYSDFIGQILPNVAEDGQVSYKFTPGPFTNILADSYSNPRTEYILIIEEINRGNAPAIFGEIFQLLDRKSETDIIDDGYPIGTSEYGITNSNIAKIVYGDPNHKVRIPSNLSIIATMNTSDQNVFTLDTAFQRRWDMRLIENNFEHVNKKLANAEILDTKITWKVFCTEINKIIVGNNARMTSAEDKRLGAYFVHLKDLEFDTKMGNLSDGEYDSLRTKEQDKSISPSEEIRLNEIRTAMKQNRKFPEKVIKYLWDDAFKFNREVVFETAEFQSLEQIIRTFMYSEGIGRFSMFKENVRNAFTNPNE